MASHVQRLMARSALRSGLHASPGASRFRCTLKTPAETLSSAPADDSTRPAASESAKPAPKPGNPWRHFQAFGSMDEYVETTLLHYDNDGTQEHEEDKGKDT